MDQPTPPATASASAVSGVYVQKPEASVSPRPVAMRGAMRSILERSLQYMGVPALAGSGEPVPPKTEGEAEKKDKAR